MNLTVNPLRSVIGAITVPGDKSISHRVALLAALAQGASCLRNFSTGRDCRATLKILSQLGIVHEELEPGTVTIFGCGGKLSAPSQILDCENSGTTARLLMGVLAGQPFAASVDGDDSLRRRPMEYVAAALREMGSAIFTSDGKKNLPLKVSGGSLVGRNFALDRASAQLKSALLFAGLQARGTTRVTEDLPTRDHTERAMRLAGIRLETDGTTISVEGGQMPKSFAVTIPGDLSSAAFWMALAAPLQGSRIILHNVGLNRRRLGFVDALLHMGAGIREEVISCDEGEWFGNLDIRGDQLRPIQVQPIDLPSLIDEIPLLAVLAAKARGVSTIRGAGALRIKECDRITATVTNLQKMGVEVEEFPDGMTIYGTGNLHGAELQSYGDHRIAMAFAIAGLLASEKQTIIHDTDCIAVSYPSFHRDLLHLIKDSVRELAFS